MSSDKADGSAIVDWENRYKSELYELHQKREIGRPVTVIVAV